MSREMCINLLLSKANQKVSQVFKTELAEYQMTPAQLGALSCLWEKDGRSPSQIAAYLNLDTSTITGILDRLGDHQLSYRTLDPSDRRALKVCLDEKGKSLQEPMEMLSEKLNNELLASFTPDEKETLKRLLLKLINE